MLDGVSVHGRRHAAASYIWHDADAGRQRYVSAMMSIYEGQPFLSRLMLDAGRWYVAQTVVALQAGFDARDRSSWPTLSLVQQTLSELGLASARRVNDIVARMVQTGFVEATALAGDRRVRILTPTARMLAHHQATREALDDAAVPLRSGGVLTPTAPVAPGLDAIVRSARALQVNAPVLFFQERDVGIAILMSLVRQGRGDTDLVCFTRLGRSFGVSRTHVRLLLREAARLGYLAEAGGRFTVSPTTTASFDRFLADKRAAFAARPRLDSGEGGPA